jgi:hypothetical protein
MYVKIDRNTCNHHIAKCERCLGRFLANPLGYERQCFEDIVDDGKDILTLDITSGDNQYHLELTPDEAKMIAGEGWAKVLEIAGAFD